jgi:hypothetical protein
MLLNERNTFDCVDSKGVGCVNGAIEEDDVMRLLIQGHCTRKNDHVPLELHARSGEIGHVCRLGMCGRKKEPIRYGPIFC